MEENGVEAPPEQDGVPGTLVHVAVDGRHAGRVLLADTPREDARSMIGDLESQGLEAVLLTVDREEAARDAAWSLGISLMRAKCLPGEKLAAVDSWEKEGKAVCMVGDGVNDAPALKRVTVGIAMGGIGSDIAMEAADIVLVSDKISALPHLTALSRRMMGVIKANMTFSLLLNAAAVAIAVTGILTPVPGALIHNAGSVLVTFNSFLLLGWRRKGEAPRA